MNSAKTEPSSSASTTVASEHTSLLLGHQESSRSCYGATTTPHNNNNNQHQSSAMSLGQQHRHRARRNHHHHSVAADATTISSLLLLSATTTTLLAIFLLTTTVSLLFLRKEESNGAHSSILPTHNHHLLGATATATASSSDDEFLLATDVVDVVATNNNNTTTTSISFCNLARALLPSWYALTVSHMDIFTNKTVLPHQVYATRKILLKTRDLMDVFGPAYPNTTRATDYLIYNQDQHHSQHQQQSQSSQSLHDYYNSSKNTSIDLWTAIREQLNVGYMAVGHFQDLHNAHIRYTPEQLDDYRSVVLHWSEDFDKFHQDYNVALYLAESPPCGGGGCDTCDTCHCDCGASHHYRHDNHESRLFWKTLRKRARGTDPATPWLQYLGRNQVRRAMKYSQRACEYQTVLNETAHVAYHNLRKELRSITDEYDVLGSVMFVHNNNNDGDQMRILKRARKLLGDINDDWTAYDFYVQHGNEYPAEQSRLVRQIDAGWRNFQSWVEQVDFRGTLQRLGESLNATTLPVHDNHNHRSHCHSAVASPSCCSWPEVDPFLAARKEHPTRHLVIGNEAGDADSIVSAISLAYIESEEKGSIAVQKTPIASISKSDLETRRPEIRLLCELAGISVDHIISVDDPLLVEDAISNDVTLVDHNVLAENLQEKNWTVLEIVDHHQDEGQYLETCSGAARTVAFESDKALVASACTLVAERLKASWEPPYPPSLGLLLLGVILLDSVNLSTEVGKVTQRDRDAVHDLLEHSSWQDLKEESRQVLNIASSSSGPDPTTVFRVLQSAKYAPSFWQSLSVEEALGLDYKDYWCAGGLLFGISTVLMSAQDFVPKRDFMSGIEQYMTKVGVELLGIMFAFEDELGQLHRQLALCGTCKVPIQDMVAFLLNGAYDQEESLKLKEMGDFAGMYHIKHSGLTLRFFDQLNIKPSRKQIGPILLQFFESTHGHTSVPIVTS